ncbi:MAG TPA: quinone oxidoreductase [Gemmatimonadales bacterium]|nr:quinone oxidoreductase [Gemmatimonadales bacterium]
MRAIRIHEYGGPEAMRLEELPTPTPGPGQALVRIHTAGVNFIDVYHRTGLYKLPLPLTLGQEAAGVVEAVGPGVTEVKVGDRVVNTGVQGTYATHALFPADRLVPVPDGMDLSVAAALPLQGITAEYLATTTYPLKPGDTCLIHAAAGGVGLLLTQIAKRRGATVIGTVSTAEKERLAREAGADHVVRYTEQEVPAEVQRITGGVGVQVVYDSVGRTTFEGSLASLATRGMMVSFGQSSGPVPPIDIIKFGASGGGSLFLSRPSLKHYIRTREELLARMGDVLRWVSEGWLKVRIERAVPLTDAAQAHRLLESRATAGKVVVAVSGEG